MELQLAVDSAFHWAAMSGVKWAAVRELTTAAMTDFPMVAWLVGTKEPS